VKGRAPAQEEVIPPLHGACYNLFPSRLRLSIEKAGTTVATLLCESLR
jgi:hypothetical protein